MRKFFALFAFVLFLLILCFLVFQLTEISQFKVIQQVVTQIFTSPNQELFAVLDTAESGGAVLGQGVAPDAPETPSLLGQQLQKMYGTSFTPKAYTSFVNHRLPLTHLLLARKQSCTVRMETFQCAEQPNTPGAYFWTATLSVQLPGREAQTVDQSGLADFSGASGQQLTYFALTGDALSRAILGK